MDPKEFAIKRVEHYKKVVLEVLPSTDEEKLFKIAQNCAKSENDELLNHLMIKLDFDFLIQVRIELSHMKFN